METENLDDLQGKDENEFSNNSDSESDKSNNSNESQLLSPAYEIHKSFKDSPSKSEEKIKEFQATLVSDRSLVIKICTKNKSLYSVSTPSIAASSSSEK